MATRRRGDGDPVEDLVREFRRAAQGLDGPLAAERLAADLDGMFRLGDPFAEPEEVLARAGLVVKRLLAVGDDVSLGLLRALAAVSSEDVAEAAATVAEALARRGVTAPGWADGVGGASAVAAYLMVDTAFGDGDTVFVEFAEPSHPVGVYIDRTLGGLAKHVLVAGSWDALAPELDEGAVGTLDLAEARVRVEQAFRLTDSMLDATVGETLPPARALVLARMRTLPAGAERPSLRRSAPAEREALLDRFLRSPSGAPFAGDPDAEAVGALAIDFKLDHVDGEPTRWSPGVVELFLADWLPRKVLEEPAFFARVPEVLRAWVRFAAADWGSTPALVDEVLAAVDHFAPELAARTRH